MKPFMPPLSDAEFHSYLNGQGQLTRPEELRLRIYHGGVEPSLRKVQHRGLNSAPHYSGSWLVCIISFISWSTVFFRL